MDPDLMALEDRKHTEVIEQWISTVIRNEGIRRFDELHIDKVEPRWNSKNEWIEGGLESFRIALELRDRNRLPFTVALGFSLDSGDRLRGVDFQGREELRDRLNWSPPSLYLFHRGKEPDTQSTTGTVQHLDPAVLGATREVRCYYLEFNLDGAGEYSRSVFIDG